ncbi:SLBB domain-containing protein [Aestuariispira insulae]|uniref:Protein involved in polysaccharide export with SLBB domain n=1 Tax=Aestuariispira insulae TaxID=1461337 RepID=A0A3D9H2U3_9PROT|nr:SLBB domain-containing protein [Aestuariispira insulae]RED43800.1 protein involved in polysaccharide export with SLBB domain [Aestuariispira insulae]
MCTAMHWFKKLIIGIAFACAASIAQAAPTENQPLQVGDVLKIFLPGEEAFDQAFQIRADGSVILPEVGEIDLAGMPLSEAEQTIRDRLSVAYRDLGRLEVSLSDRRLLIQVLGLVNEPGEVDLAATANIQTAIQVAGGLKQGAQLDRLQLRRGSLVVTFNYKEYLDTGDIAILPSLKPKDIVFVPASPLIGNVQVNFDAQTLTAAGDGTEDGTAVKVFGEVISPGSFAYKTGQSVVDLIMRAGGVTRYAGVEKIRVMNGDEPALFDLKQYLDTGDKDSLPEIRPGSTIYVPIRVEEVKSGGRTVYVMGEVAKPGAFEMTEGASFFDILANSGGPNRYAETRQLRVIRANGEVVPFDLGGYTEGRGTNQVPVIQPGDAIFVPEKADQLEKSWLKISPERAIQIIGQVVRPGRYEWSDEMSMLDLLAHAGGPTRQADMSKLQILKTGEGKASTIDFDLQKFIDHGGALSDLPVLKAGYTVMIPELPRDPSDNKAQWVRQASDRSIYVMGAVGSPGRYAFNDNLHFLDIIAAADGPRTDADLQNIRVTHRGHSDSRVTPLNLSLYFETGDETLLPRVLPGDVIYVPSRNRDWTEVPSGQMVRVIGSVGSPGRYKFDDSMTILDLLAEAGGPSADAWAEKIVVVNLVEGEPKAQAFDLVNFARQGDFGSLPVIRAGDTVYVPSIEQSDWKIFMNGVRDVVSITSVFALLGGL